MAINWEDIVDKNVTATTDRMKKAGSFVARNGSKISIRLGDKAATAIAKKTGYESEYNALKAKLTPRTKNAGKKIVDGLVDRWKRL